MGDPDFVVVDGVPVMLPSYDEAVSSGLNALAPGYSAAADQGHILQTEDQNPPAYPGPRIPDTLPSEFETCGSRSGSSELLQSLYPSLTCQGAALPGSDQTDISQSTDGDAASTSPRIDITDDSFDGRRPLACTELSLRHIALWGDMNHEDSEIEKTLCGIGEGVFLLINLPRSDVTRLGVCLNPQQG